MFDLSLTELLLITVVVVIFIRPSDIPVVLKTVGKGVRAVRKLAREIGSLFDEAMEEAELKEILDDENASADYLIDQDGKPQKTYRLGDIQEKKE